MLKVIGIWNLRVRIWKFFVLLCVSDFLNFLNGVNTKSV